MSLVLAVGGMAAQSALAAGVPFHRGDVLTSVGGGINLYAPDGTLKDTFARGTGAGSLCFDPSGTRLIAPGAGLFDLSGNLLPSYWGSASFRNTCSIDGSGHVYVGGPGGIDPLTSQLFGTIGKFDLTGNLLRSYTVDAVGTYSGSGYWADPDLAPDQCTLYYDTSGGHSVGRFNVCTNTQEPVFGSDTGGLKDQLRVLPDWQVAMAVDNGALLFDASGLRIHAYTACHTPAARFITIDPEGTSFWLGTLNDSPGVCRLDVKTGQLLTSWNVSGCGSNLCSVRGIAAFAPPLLGNANVASRVESKPAGTAEAFVTPVRYSGQMSRLHLYVDSSTATQAVIGIYSDRNGHPGALQEQATIAKVMPRSWNYVDVPSMSVTAGQRYWIAVLAPSGGGTVRFRNATSGLGSETSSQHKLTSLPARWSTGTTYAGGRLSAYVG